MGESALTTNVSGANNTAVGANALNNTTVANNSGFGQGSGGSISTGADNTCIGFLAGNYENQLTTGGSSTVIGAYARTSAAGVSGEIAIGRYVLAQGASTATLGVNGSGVSIAIDNSTTTWSKHSDERLKENIEDCSAGLSFITKLRSITYNWKSKKDIPKEFENYYEDSDDPVHGDSSKTKQTNHGFIAQEVKEAIDKHPEIKNNGAIWSKSPDGIQKVSEGALVPMMVKAIQELSASNDDLKARIETLENA